MISFSITSWTLWDYLFKTGELLLMRCVGNRSKCKDPEFLIVPNPSFLKVTKKCSVSLFLRPTTFYQKQGFINLANYYYWSECDMSFLTNYRPFLCRSSIILKLYFSTCIYFVKKHTPLLNVYLIFFSVCHFLLYLYLLTDIISGNLNPSTIINPSLYRDTFLDDNIIFQGITLIILLQKIDSSQLNDS